MNRHDNNAPCGSKEWLRVRWCAWIQEVMRLRLTIGCSIIVKHELGMMMVRLRRRTSASPPDPLVIIISFNLNALAGLDWCCNNCLIASPTPIWFALYCKGQQGRWWWGDDDDAAICNSIRWKLRCLLLSLMMVTVFIPIRWLKKAITLIYSSVWMQNLPQEGGPQHKWWWYDDDYINLS